LPPLDQPQPQCDQAQSESDRDAQDAADYAVGERYLSDLLNGQITMLLDELNRAIRHHIRILIQDDSSKATEFQKLYEFSLPKNSVAHGGGNNFAHGGGRGGLLTFFFFFFCGQ
jgi:hypothetical protein